MKPIGIQLYSLRKDVYPGGSDLPGVLKTVAEIGFKGVEFAGLHGNDPKEIGKMVSDLGLQVTSSHTGIPNKENAQEMIERESALGNTRMISGIGGDDVKTVDDCKAAAERFRLASELLKPHGMTFGFHNHWWEFFTVDGQRVYDILLKEAPDVFNELDVYWTAYAKVDPVELIKQYSSRLPLLHIKDGMLKQDEMVHTAVGSGLMKIPEIIRAADPNVLQWVIVELDNCATDMLEAVRESYRYLTSEGLASGSK